MEKIFTKRNTVYFLAALTAWRTYLALTLQLHPDEAYYWLWSRNLAPGYYDHAPMIAWFIKATTLFSQGELWVRLSGILAALVMSLCVWLLAKQLFNDEKIASGSVITLNAYPLTMAGSIIITPDIPSFVFWSLAVYLFWQIVRTKDPRYWYAFGAAFGLSLLSKYTAVLLAPVLLLFLLCTDERRWLKTPHPYLSMAVAFLFFTPVIYWNWKHEWISFAFQMNHGLGGATYSAGKVLEYLGGQMLVAGPFVFIAGAVAAGMYLFSRNKEKFFLAVVSLPVILFFAYSSLKQVAGPNWPALAYFTFSIVVSAFLLDGNVVKRWIFIFAAVVNIAMSMLVMVHARYSIVPLERYSAEWAKADATNWFYGWRELGEEILRNPGVKVVLTPSHQLSATVEYYTREKVHVWIDPKRTRVSQYNLWGFPEELKGADGLYLYVDGTGPGPVKEYFEQLGDPASLTVFRAGHPLRKYRIIPAAGCKLPS